jgi:hypothetical protein
MPLNNSLLKLHCFLGSDRIRWITSKSSGRDPSSSYLRWAFHLKKRNHKNPKLEVKATQSQKERKNNKPTGRPWKI